jgi:hypothetical protein
MQNIHRIHTPEDNFIFHEDTIITTPENHPIIMEMDLHRLNLDMDNAVDEIKKIFNKTIIGTRISFETEKSGKDQYGQFRFIEDEIVSLTRTSYKRRTGGISIIHTCYKNPKDRISSYESPLLGFARAVIRYTKKMK